MNRREFLRALPATPLALLATPRPEAKAVWRVRLEQIPEGKAAFYAGVLDATTGELVSQRFPAQSARRLRRSLRTGQPVRLRLFQLSNGLPYLDEPNHIASEVRWVLVVGTT